MGTFVPRSGHEYGSRSGQWLAIAVGFCRIVLVVGLVAGLGAGCAATGAPPSPQASADAGAPPPKVDPSSPEEFGESCPHPRERCGDSCRDLLTDPMNCGACGEACGSGEYCSNGECTTSCASGQRSCGESCVDVETNAMHCGSCGNACPEGQFCVQGTCGCPGHLTDCGGVCVNTDEDPNHCGLCNRGIDSEEFRCNMGTPVCRAGASESDCNDGIDNDCDGLVDCADDECVTQVRECLSSCGQSSVEICQPEGTWDGCDMDCNAEEPSCTPTTEVCGDGIDQDCDGVDTINPDRYEPNNTCGTCTLATSSVDARTTVYGRIDGIGDAIDCFKFPVDDSWDPLAAESARATLTNIPVGHDYDLEIFRSYDDCVYGNAAASSTGSGNQDEEVFIWESTGDNDDGHYYVFVRRHGAQFSCESDDFYALTFDGLTL